MRIIFKPPFNSFVFSLTVDLFPGLFLLPPLFIEKDYLPSLLPIYHTPLRYVAILIRPFLFVKEKFY